MFACTSRFIWNFFRLENEHLNNCGEFRAVRDIFITPLPKRPPRTLSTQLFSMGYGAQQKSNSVYPANNSALSHQHPIHHLIHHLNHRHQPEVHKSKPDLTWTSPKTDTLNKISLQVDASTSPSDTWDRRTNILGEQSRTRRLLNRIGAATSFHLPVRALIHPTHYADNHHPHHYHHHIMDNMELTESLRSTLPRSAREEEIASHSPRGGSCSTISGRSNRGTDSPGQKVGTRMPIQREMGRPQGQANFSSSLHQVALPNDYVSFLHVR